jgi:prepilin-type N-terminal cleavage/methylation domain-containing protein
MTHAPDMIARRASPSARAQAGFTMIEVMVALLLTAIAMIGILALYMTETKASGFSRHTTEAATLAQDKIEKLRTLGPAAAQSGTDSNVNERAQPGGIYTRTWTETVGLQFATIAVTVQWSDDNVLHSVAVQARRNL